MKREMGQEVAAHLVRDLNNELIRITITHAEKLKAMGYEDRDIAGVILTALSATMGDLLLASCDGSKESLEKGASIATRHAVEFGLARKELVAERLMRDPSAGSGGGAPTQ